MPTYRYQCLDCGKTYVGPQLHSKWKCNCTPPKEITGVRVVVPLSDTLRAIVPSSQTATRRSSLCQQLGIPDKSHAAHGSNFSGSLSLVNLINDVVAPVQGDLRRAVRDSVLREFSYDIDTKEMVD